MDTLPLFAHLRDQPCLVVGGGAVAARKARALLRAGALVTVRSPILGDDIKTLAANRELSVEAAPFNRDIVEGYVLVIAATDDTKINRQVASAARARATLCNVVDDGANSSVIMPAIVDRSPVQIAISTGGHSPVLARRLKAQIEALVPARLGALAAKLGSWRWRVKQAFPDNTARRQFWEQLLDSDLLAPILDGSDTGDTILNEAIKDETNGKRGMAYLIGAGPGDPELLTLKGRRILADADVILYDRLVGDAVLDYARRDAEFIAVGKTPGSKSTSQERINALLIDRVRAGKKVVRLKGGDPFVFGRGGEELAALRGAELPCVVVPGITAAQGCAASIGLPLTHRGIAQGVTLVTAQGAGGRAPTLDWDALSTSPGTLVFYMGVSQAGEIRRELLRRLPPTTPIAVVEKGTTPQERSYTGTLTTLDAIMSDNQIKAPALLFVRTTADAWAVETHVA